jgi:VWFA-related protein
MKTISCWFVLIGLPLFVQTREKHTVELVEVPVYVSGPSGAVTGLSRDNFDLFVNGRPQSIDYFDVIDFSAIASADAGGSRDPRQRRLYLLVFDLVFSTPNSIHRTQDAAVKLMARAGDADEFAVATLTHNRGLEMLVPFTRDRMTVDRAVRSLHASGVGDALRLGITADEISLLQQAGVGGGRMSEDSAESCGPRSACAELLRDRTRDLIERQIVELSSLAPRLASLEGQKHVILLSNGFPTEYVHGVAPRPRPVDVRDQRGAKMLVGAGPPQLDARLLDDIRSLAAAYGAAGVFLDAIDTLGVRPGGITEENEALVMLARDTGGFVIERRNDLDTAMQLLTDLERVGYVLSFHVRGKRPKENSIRVKLRNVKGRPELRYRRTFSSAVAARSQVDAIRLADILVNDIPQNGIEVQATVTSGRVNIALPIAPLLAQIDVRADLDVLFYVFSEGRAVATKERRISIDRQQVAASGKDAIAFGEEFKLPAGDYVAKVIVALDDASIGFARQPFTIAP